MLAKYLSKPNGIIYVKCYANTSFFFLLTLTVIVMVMILLWSKWLQVTIASRTLILNFSFPEVRFVFFYTKSHISVGVPWMPCALCAPVCLHVHCVHTHMPWFCENDVALTPFVFVQLCITKLFVQKTYLKGCWSIWAVVWACTPTFLPLIRQTSPPNPLLPLWRLKCLWEARFENLAVIVLGLRLCTQGALSVTTRLWNRCPQVHTPKWIWLNSSF